MNKQDNYKLLIRNLRKKYNEKLTIQTNTKKEKLLKMRMGI